MGIKDYSVWYSCWSLRCGWLGWHSLSDLLQKNWFKSIDIDVDVEVNDKSMFRVCGGAKWRTLEMHWTYDLVHWVIVVFVGMELLSFRTRISRHIASPKVVVKNGVHTEWQESISVFQVDWDSMHSAPYAANNGSVHIHSLCFSSNSIMRTPLHLFGKLIHQNTNRAIIIEYKESPTACGKSYEKIMISVLEQDYPEFMRMMDRKFGIDGNTTTAAI